MKKYLKQMDVNDLLILVGMGVLAGGLALVSIALAGIVIGGLLLAIGLVGAWRKGGKSA
jgi:hypothetical protein